MNIGAAFNFLSLLDFERRKLTGLKFFGPAWLLNMICEPEQLEKNVLLKYPAYGRVKNNGKYEQEPAILHRPIGIHDF